MWRISDDDFLGRLGQTVAEVNAVPLGWPKRRKKAEPPAESEVWLAPTRDGDLGPSANGKPRPGGG
jgi:hypothetical protein